MKMQNAESYLKEDTVIYGFRPLAAGVSELTSKLEKLDWSNLFNSYRRVARFQMIIRRVIDDPRPSYMLVPAGGQLCSRPTPSL